MNHKRTARNQVYQFLREWKMVNRNEINILLVDDNPAIRKMLTSILKEGGYSNIFHADNGLTAISSIGFHDIDLVLSDWQMPEMSGFELLKKIRENEETADMPVILITAVNVKSGPARDAIRAGVNGYIEKPFTAESVLSRVDHVLKSTEDQA